MIVSLKMRVGEKINKTALQKVKGVGMQIKKKNVNLILKVIFLLLAVVRNAKNCAMESNFQ